MPKEPPCARGVARTQAVKPGPTLPANRAFVVQFRAPQAGRPLAVEGRVEHLVSGQEMRFTSWDQLVAFITRMLTALPLAP
jgi:hypothetical protein